MLAEFVHFPFRDGVDDVRLSRRILIALFVLLVANCGDATSSGGGDDSETAGETQKHQGAKAHCVEVINELRSRKDKPPLDRSKELEKCAQKAATADAKSGEPHGHFQKTRGCGLTATAENEVPGWPLDRYGSVKKVVARGAERMFAEGPGGGHYENIVGDHDAVGCGIHVTDSNEVWVVQNFN